MLGKTVITFVYFFLGFMRCNDGADKTICFSLNPPLSQTNFKSCSVSNRGFVAVHGWSLGKKCSEIKLII